MILSSLWKLTVLLFSSPRNLFLSWVVSLSITLHSTQEFRILATSGNKAIKLTDNEVVSTKSRYSSTPFQYETGMSSSSSVHHDHADAYKASIFSGFVASPQPVRNTTLYFLLLSFSSPYVSTIFPSSEILDGDIPAPQCWPGIWRWWITVLFSSTVLLLMPLSFMLSSFFWIATGKENGSPYDVLGDSLDLCGTIISSLNRSPRSPLCSNMEHVVV